MTLTRNLKRFLILWRNIFYCFASLQNGFSHLQHGYRLEQKMINSFENYSILNCVEECLRTVKCQSVNYHKGANLCEINYEKKATAEDHYIVSYGWIYTNAIDWIKELAGTCSNSICGTNETCISLPSGGYKCALSDCGVPVIPGANMDSVGRWDAIGIERTMKLECLGNYVKNGTGLLRCSINGQWTIDLSCVWHTFGNHLYTFFPDLTTSELAKKQCLDNTAYLVEIDSLEENKWILNLYNDHCMKDAQWCDVWVGASDTLNEGKFTWSRNGNPVTFTNWARGQPDNAGRVEDCVHLWSAGQWNDANCNVLLPFICEKDVELNTGWDRSTWWEAGVK